MSFRSTGTRGVPRLIIIIVFKTVAFVAAETDVGPEEVLFVRTQRSDVRLLYRPSVVFESPRRFCLPQASEQGVLGRPRLQ